MNQYMNRVAISSSQDADVILFVIEAMQFTDEDMWVWSAYGSQATAVLGHQQSGSRLPKEKLLPFLEDMMARIRHPESCRSRRSNPIICSLGGSGGSRLPLSPPLFAADVLTDRDEPFMRRVVREKLTLKLREELPYGINVQIERFADEDNRIMINAVIWWSASQKAIVIVRAANDSRKSAARAHRAQRSMQRSVHLELWVKVKENWADSEMALRQFGYDTL